jgi:hypothetical protein
LLHEKYYKTADQSRKRRCTRNFDISVFYMSVPCS